MFPGLFKHVEGEINSGDSAAWFYKSPADPASSAAKLKDGRSIPAVSFVKLNIFCKTVHLHGVEFSIPQGAQWKKNLIRFFMVCKGVVHHFLLHALGFVIKEKVHYPTITCSNEQEIGTMCNVAITNYSFQNSKENTIACLYH